MKEKENEEEEEEEEEEKKKKKKKKAKNDSTVNFAICVQSLVSAHLFTKTVLHAMLKVLSFISTIVGWEPGSVVVVTRLRDD